ncbi:hypothetical protein METBISCDRAFT_28431 [Metschnikowia bicuspidata]|uniref:Transcription factor domain-containing protein n=1 Tax=Metschnikowia bicuspidata TaxID=27322 RepID=A0A4P9Z902_9ASCO|nr:hypothetical protein METBISCDRAFT_28431 [Metschnikowia bicuspidata]
MRQSTHNPFKVLLPKMAMDSPGVLTAILSCILLLQQLEDTSEATSVGTLAIIMLLRSYEEVYSEDFDKHRTHTYDAGQIVLTTCLQCAGHEAGSCPASDASASCLPEKSNIAYFLMRWYTYVNVIGALPSTKCREQYLRAYRSHGNHSAVDWWAGDIDLATHPQREIDYLLGFYMRMFPHLVDLAFLLDEAEAYLRNPGIDRFCLPQHIVVVALELKERLIRDNEAAEARRLLLDNTLRCTNKLFLCMGLLKLYQCVLLVPRGLPLVQGLVTQMAHILRDFIEPGSPVEICTICCNFCCGCDVEDA